MPLYDYRCPSCGPREQFSLMAFRREQRCEMCGSDLEFISHPPPRGKDEYKPFNSYFDEGLGAMVTGRDHRRRLMRDLQCDYRDHPSPGDVSARKDRCNEIRKERARG